MSDLNKETIKKLMHLCRIDCTEEEQDSLLKDLSNILDYIELLQEVDTSHVEPCSHVLANIYNALRDDDVGETLSREEFLANAPEHIGGMVKVPTIISQK